MNQASKLLLLLTALAALPLAAIRAEDTNRWRVDAALNLFLSGLDGDLAARGVPTTVDADFSDIAEHLNFAAAGRLSLGKGHWTFSTEVSYMDLGATTPNARASLDQWLVEPSLSYNFCDAFAVFVGARYNSIETGIDLNGPLALVTSGQQDWVDPIVGAQIALPLAGEKLSLNGRFDIGGFDVGSELTWQVFPYFDWRFAKSASLQLGFRWLGIDYETGAGPTLFRYDVVLAGPQIGLTMHF
jgi:hypothetical protein